MGIFIHKTSRAGAPHLEQCSLSIFIGFKLAHAQNSGYQALISSYGRKCAPHAYKGLGTRLLPVTTSLSASSVSVTSGRATPVTSVRKCTVKTKW